MPYLLVTYKKRRRKRRRRRRRREGEREIAISALFSEVYFCNFL
jgi:hypothetical protein